MQGQIVVLGNRCITLCPEKCILCQVPIVSKEMCSEQLECFPVSSRRFGESEKMSGDKVLLDKIKLDIGTFKTIIFALIEAKFNCF